MKCISIRQPNATYVAAGLKKIENRTWNTKYRGELYIHASGDDYAWPDASYLPDSVVERMQPWIGADDLSELPDDLRIYHDLVVGAFRHYGVPFDPHDDLSWLTRKKAAESGYYLPAQSIIGKVNLVDVVRDSADEFAEYGKYHFVLDNAELFETPIWPVNGRLRIFEVEV